MRGSVTRRGAAVSVLLLTLAALGLRLHGLSFGLPHFTHDDGRVLVEQVAAMRAGQPDPEGTRLYPHLVPRVASWWPAGSTPAPQAPLAEHLTAAGRPFLQARLASVWLSLLLLPATYLLARTTLRRPGALLAVALVATSLLHVSFSQQARPHGALASFSALTVVAALGLRRNPRPARYVLAGALAALAVGCLHSGLAVLPALLAAHFLRVRGEPRTSPAWILAPLLLVAAAIGVFYPFHFRSSGAASELAVEQKWDQSVFDLSGHFVRLEHFDGGGFADVLGGLASYDPLLAGLGVLGAVAALVALSRGAGSGARGRELAVLAAYALPYLLAVGLYGKSPERFGLPLLPFVAMLAAGAVAAVPGPGVVRGALGLVVVVATALAAGHLTRVRAAPDTYLRTAAWAEANIDPGERMLALLDPYQDLPLARSADALAAGADWKWSSPWFAYQARQPRPIEGARALRSPAGIQPARLVEDPLGALASLEADWVVVELVPGRGPRSAVQRSVREALRAGAAPARRESPLAVDDGGATRLFVRQASWRPFVLRRWLAARSTGPTLEVYRLR